MLKEYSSEIISGIGFGCGAVVCGNDRVVDMMATNGAA